jgi:hypothetical protein
MIHSPFNSVIVIQRVIAGLTRNLLFAGGDPARHCGLDPQSPAVRAAIVVRDMITWREQKNNIYWFFLDFLSC